MNRLTILTLVLALILLPFYGGLLLKPAWLREGLRRFPRHAWLGRLLAAASVIWAAWVLHAMPLGRFEGLKPGLIPAALLLLVLVCFYMGELLAPRALGALLLLYPAPLLEAARLHPSSWSVVMSLVAYIMIVKGMLLLLSPYQFRHASERFLDTDTKCRLAGGAGLVFDAALVLLALTVY